ncbi:hypothetical protein EJB05_14990, partial [Eragrostis curvula]
MMSSPGERPRCAACAHSKRKCSPECVYAPHFPPDDPDRFAAVHKAFLVRNIGQLLRELPPDQRAGTADLLVAMARAARPDHDERLAENLQELRALLNPAPEPEPEAPGRPRCAACKKVHDKCTPDCVLAPFFPPCTMCSATRTPPPSSAGSRRPWGGGGGAADALVYSALARSRDPVHGCVGEISALTARIKQVYEVLGATKAKLAGDEEAAGVPNPDLKLLAEVAPGHRAGAVESLVYEARARLRDPAFGCVSYITVLEHMLKQGMGDVAAAHVGAADAYRPFDGCRRARGWMMRCGSRRSRTIRCGPCGCRRGEPEGGPRRGVEGCRETWARQGQPLLNRQMAEAQKAAAAAQSAREQA